VKPDTAVTVGNVKAVPPQVFAGAEMLGAAGKITTLTVLLAAQPAGAEVPAAFPPQAEVRTYRADTVWQPTDVGIVGEAAKVPPSMLYSTVNPDTEATVGNVNAEAQVLAGAVMVGAAGKITTLTVLLAAQPAGAVAPADKPAQADVSTYRVDTV
jgi:hypothetical protein